MRFDELALRIPGDELRMRFHDRLTVLTGLSALERQGLIEGLLGTLTGSQRHSTVLAYRDAQNRRVRVTRDDDGALVSVFDDGTPAPDLAAMLGLDAAGLSQLCRVSAADVGLLAPVVPSHEESPELAEARAALRALTEELEEAVAKRDAAELLREELAQLDERIRTHEDGLARRRYARLLAELERVRAEAAAIRGGEAAAEADRRFLAGAAEASRLAEAWRAAARELEAARDRFGTRERLDPRTLAEAADIPAEVPAELDALVLALEVAEQRRDRLAGRLQELAANELPDPSSPDVIRLAGADQDELWDAARAVLAADREVEQASIDLGGVASEGHVAQLVDRLEAAHQHVDQAERVLETRRQTAVVGASLTGMASVGGMFFFLPLTPLMLLAAIAFAVWGIVAPRVRLRRAHVAEDQVLAEAGIGSYLGFHIRRIDATIDPAARERLNVAVLERRVAQSRWNELAGDVDPLAALELEAEVRAYGAALASLSGAADEIEAVRLELVTEAEPAVASALEALLAACEPYGVDDPAIAAKMVRAQVETASTARLQRTLEEAEAAEAAAAGALHAHLDELGVAAGDPDARIEALDRSVAACREREGARVEGRPREVVEAELAELELRARREFQPEWGPSVEPDDSEEPDLDDLKARRGDVAKAYQEASRNVPDIDRLADRRSAVERRVNVLEAASGDGSAAVLADVADVERYLLARITSARSVGGGSECLPVILDEPFARIRGERKWEILDLVERLAEKTQIVYLSDDGDVQLWARRRAGTGSLLLLEPVAADADAAV